MVELSAAQEICSDLRTEQAQFSSALCCLSQKTLARACKLIMERDWLAHEDACLLQCHGCPLLMLERRVFLEDKALALVKACRRRPMNIKHPILLPITSSEEN